MCIVFTTISVDQTTTVPFPAATPKYTPVPNVYTRSRTHTNSCPAMPLETELLLRGWSVRRGPTTDYSPSHVLMLKKFHGDSSYESKALRIYVTTFSPVVCFLLGDSPASEFYMPTFRKTLFHLHRQVSACAECSETSEYRIQPPGNHPKESIQHSGHGESLKSRMHSVLLEKLTVGLFIPHIL